MRWRPLLAVLLSLALPLPLAWLLYASLFGHPMGEESSLSLPPGVQLLPMLTLEERLRLPTYERDCRSDEDCDPQLRCFFNMLSQRSYCTDSMCMTDQQCPDGFACRLLTTRDRQDVLRACSLVGVRGDGEVCVALPRERENGCRESLRCRGRCGRPCRPDEPTSCPEGHFCEEDVAGATCQPTCEGRTCPEGQQCVPRGERVSICARVFGPNCLQSPCPSGQSCSVDDSFKVADAVWMQCMPPCGSPEDAPCPEGTVCYFYSCRTACTREDPSACPPGFACNGRPGEPLTCVPSSKAARAN
jgi:hypothetical protein